MGGAKAGPEEEDPVCSNRLIPARLGTGGLGPGEATGNALPPTSTGTNRGLPTSTLVEKLDFGELSSLEVCPEC